MKILKVLNEFRPEHRAMYFGKREELNIEFDIDSDICKDVIKELNQKLNDDLETENMLMEDPNIDHNLYSFLRTQDVLEEGMSFVTKMIDGVVKRELILDDLAKDMLKHFRLVNKNVFGMDTFCLTPKTIALQYQVLYYDYDILVTYIKDVVDVLVNYNFAEIVEIKK